MYKYVFVLITFFISGNISAAGWMGAQTVKEVNVENGNGCVKLNNGQRIRLDLESGAGKSEFSLALTAMSTGKRLKVYQTDSLTGGCNSGNNIKKHSAIRLVD